MSALKDRPDPFMQTMRGHYPASDNAGAARHWTDANGVPLPDRSIGTLFWLSLLVGIFGFDHFYLRSPMTGLLKLLTVGGFGLWWLWDLLQITTEKERVKMYGLTTPLDLTTGIGQGMITEKSNYVQKTSFITYSFLAMLGLEALTDGKFAQLIRRVVDLTHFLSAGYAVMNPSLSLIARFFAAIPMVVYGLFALLPWFAVVSAVVSGAEEGIVLHPSVDKLVNYFSFYTRSLGTKVGPDSSHTIVEDVLREEFGYTNVPAAEFQKKFRIVHREELSGEKKEEENTSKWMPALWMGPLIPGIITRALMAIPVFGNYVAVAVYSVFGDTAAKQTAMMGLTPAGAAAQAVASAAGVNVGAALQQASQLKNLATNPTALLGAAVPGAALQQASQLKNLATNPTALLGAAVPGAALQQAQNVATALGKIPPAVQTGGARADPLSTESKVLGAALFALIVGGGIKGIVDHVVQE